MLRHRCYRLASFLVVCCFVGGCKTLPYETMKRPPEGTPVIVYHLDTLYPIFAEETQLAIGAIREVGDSLTSNTESLGFDYRRRIERLYSEMDQLNAQLRTFVVAHYTSYINGWLDSDAGLRREARNEWQSAIERLEKDTARLREVETKLRQGTFEVERVSFGNCDFDLGMERTADACGEYVFVPGAVLLDSLIADVARINDSQDD